MDLFLFFYFFLNCILRYFYHNADAPHDGAEHARATKSSAEPTPSTRALPNHPRNQRGTNADATRALPNHPRNQRGTNADPTRALRHILPSNLLVKVILRQRASCKIPYILLFLRTKKIFFFLLYIYIIDTQHYGIPILMLFY